MLAPARSAGLLEVRLRRTPVAVDMAGDRARAVTLRALETGMEELVGAEYVLDATELGDLLPLAGVEYVTGAESQTETGEPLPIRVENVLPTCKYLGVTHIQHRRWPFSSQTGLRT